MGILRFPTSNSKMIHPLAFPIGDGFCCVMDGRRPKAGIYIVNENDLEDFERRLLNESIPQSVRRFTLDLWLQTTRSCNLRCPYCFVDQTHSVPLDTGTLNPIYEKIADTLTMEDIGGLNIRFAGGEPLLNFKRWAEFAEKLAALRKETNKKITLGLITNGTLLDDTIAAFCVKNSIHINISLDGVGDSHDITRKTANGTGSFALILDNILKLRSLNCPVRVLTTLTDDNCDGLTDLVSFCVKNCLALHVSLPKCQTKPLDVDRISNSLLSALKSLDRHIDSGFDFAANFRFCDLHIFESREFTCLAGIAGCAMNTVGEVYFCQMVMDKGEKPLGTIFDDQNLVSLIQAGYDRQFVVKDACKECDFFWMCSGGCPIERENVHDSICQIIQKTIPLIVQLTAKQKLIDSRKR